MKAGIKSGLVAGILALSSGMLFGAIDPQIYNVIVERNPFGVRPPPPQPVAPALPNNSTNLVLVGLLEINGKRSAYFTSKDTTRTNLPTSYTVGDDVGRQDDLELIKIDMKTRAVEIKKGGIQMTLTLEENGMKQAYNGAPAPGQIGYTGAPGQPTYVGNTRATFTPGTTYAPPTPLPGNGSAYPTSRTTTTVPTRPLRLGAQPQPPSQIPQPVVDDRAMEQSRAIHQDSINRGDIPPLPPTPGYPQ